MAILSFRGGDSHRTGGQRAENQKVKFCENGHPPQKIEDGHRLKRFGAVDGDRGRPGEGCHLFAAIVCRILQAQLTAADRDLVLVEITNCLAVNFVCLLSYKVFKIPSTNIIQNSLLQYLQ